MTDADRRFAERRGRVLDLAEESNVGAVAIYGNLFAQGAIRHLTGFGPRRDSYLYLEPGRPP